MDDGKKARDQHQNIEKEQVQQQVVPVLEQDYSISKETSIKDVKIEKKLVTEIKTVEVPLVCEELYINDKKLKSVKEFQIFSAFKDKITSLASRSNTSTSVDQSIKKKNIIENRGELIPLFPSSSDEDSSKTQREKENEKERIIPLYEEQFEIIRKRVKVAEIVITKRRVTEKKKIDIDISTEEVTLEYPDGRSERLS
jgi:stress response protein YsnF